MNPSYPSNLTSEQWELLSGLIPTPKTGGRKRSVDMQAIINAILYILCAGCAWRMLPNDFPKWKTVYHYFRQWRKDGTWFEIHERLRLWVRVSQNREASPSELWTAKALKQQQWYRKKLVMTLAKRLRDENAIYLLIHLVYSLLL